MKAAFAVIILAAGTIVALVAWPSYPAPGEYEIEILNEGAAPRSPLRLTPAVGRTQRCSMTVESSMSMAAGGKRSPKMEMPTITVAMEATASNVDPNGDITFDFSFPDASGTGPGGGAVGAALDGLIGLAGYGVMTDRGVSKEIGFLDTGLDASAQVMADSMKRSLTHISIPFPEEAVGVGARWKVTMGLDMDGIQLVQTATYTLDSRTDSVITLSVELTQTAPAQDLSSGVPNLPSNASAKLNSLEFTGSGTLTMDLAQLLPTRGSVSVSGDTEIEMSMGGNEQEMEMGLEMVVTVQGQ